jgi:hypothetical protein
LQARTNRSKINNTSYSSSSPSSSLERNKQLLERFLQSNRSEVYRSNVLDYIHAFMRHWNLYEEKGGDLLKDDGNDGDDGDSDTGCNNKKNKRQKSNNVIFRYDWLIGDDYHNDDGRGVRVDDYHCHGARKRTSARAVEERDIQTLQDRIIQFVIHKKKEGLGANGIDNYINPLRKFYWVNGVKGIDWELVRSYRPEHVKKTQDREYHAEEVIAIEEKLDVRGKVVSGVMRGSGVRRGAEASINLGDLIPLQTKYGKIYKIWVYRGTSDMYATACTPEVAARIDAYFDYRMRFGETCKLFGKGVDHMHEYYDGEEVIQKWFKADEPHLDPDAPLIREGFDRTDSFAAKHPKRISFKQIGDIIRDGAIAAGIRKVNKGEPFKRHKIMMTHGFRKLFKKRCRQAKVDLIVLERLLGHKSGNPKDGITKLMMTYDPEDWAEMQAEFEKAIPNLTITKDAMIQAELEAAKAQLKSAPAIEQIQAQQQSMQYQMKKLEENMMAIFEKYADKDLKRAEPELKKIKDENKLNIVQSQLLWDSGVEAEVELEVEKEEEAWREVQAAVSTDDPLLNDIDYTSDFLNRQEEDEEGS